MSTHRETSSVTSAGPARPGVREIGELLDELERLRVDPFATDVDWLGYVERKADLLGRIATELGTDDAYAAAGRLG